MLPPFLNWILNIIPSTECLVNSPAGAFQRAGSEGPHGRTVGFGHTHRDIHFVYQTIKMLHVSAYLSCQWNFYWDRNKFCQETSIKCHHKHNGITIRKYESYLQKYSKIRTFFFNFSFGRERGCFLICGTKFSQQCPGSQRTRQRNTKYWDSVLS